MHYYQKYLKYKYKFENLLGGSSVQILQEDPVVLEVFLKKVLDLDLTKINSVINDDLLKLTKKDCKVNLLEFINKKNLDLSYDWNNFYDWETIFLNSIPTFYRNFEKIHNNPKTNLDVYKLFNQDFKFFTNIVENTVLNYKNNIKLPWYPNGIDVSNSANIFLHLNRNKDNSYATKIQIPDNSKIAIIGDIHSSFHSLYNITLKLRSLNFFENDTMKLRSNKYIIFTGDIIDYGPYGLEVMWYILTLLYHNPNQIIICKGNHEDLTQYSFKNQFGLNFLTELETQFLNDDRIKNLVTTILALLPTVVFVKFKNKIYQFNHGSIDLKISGFNPEDDGSFETSKSILFKFLNDESYNHLFISDDYGNNYKWGDFYYNPNNLSEKSYNYSRKEELNISRPKHHIFLIQKYLTAHNIECIISGHQDTVAVGVLPKDPSVSELIINEETKDKLFWTRQQGMLNTGKINKNDYELDNYSFKLYPNQDIIAVTLSTAVPSKLVKFHTFAILS